MKQSLTKLFTIVICVMSLYFTKALCGSSLGGGDNLLCNEIASTNTPTSSINHRLDHRLDFDCLLVRVAQVNDHEKIKLCNGILEKAKSSDREMYYKLFVASYLTKLQIPETKRAETISREVLQSDRSTEEEKALARSYLEQISEYHQRQTTKICSLS